MNEKLNEKKLMVMTGFEPVTIKKLKAAKKLKCLAKGSRFSHR
jgi:hypothetical protein